MPLRTTCRPSQSTLKSIRATPIHKALWPRGLRTLPRAVLESGHLRGTAAPRHPRLESGLMTLNMAGLGTAGTGAVGPYRCRARAKTPAHSRPVQLVAPGIVQRLPCKAPARTQRPTGSSIRRQRLSQAMLLLTLSASPVSPRHGFRPTAASPALSIKLSHPKSKTGHSNPNTGLVWTAHSG